MQKIDVFISRKSSDAPYAKQIYDYLTDQGLTVFDSDHTLKELGNADYIKAIDEALASATHMIVVGSSAKNIKSSWVEAEWLFFLNRKRSGKTSGNLFTVVSKDLKIEDLPASLSNYEVIPFNKKNFPLIFNYVREVNTPAKVAPKSPFPAEKQNKYLIGIIALLLITILSAFIYVKNQPVDITLFAKPDASLKLSPSYPAFKGGEISLLIGDKEERKQLLANGEINLKQIPASFIGSKVPVKLFSKFWKIDSDSIVLNKSITLKLIPDGSLSQVYGKVMDQDGITVSNVTLTIDTDTIITNQENGIFKIILPNKMQKEYYAIEYSKQGFENYKANYYPVSGYTDISLPKKKN